MPNEAACGRRRGIAKDQRREYRREKQHAAEHDCTRQRAENLSARASANRWCAVSNHERSVLVAEQGALC
jgi:hypothetical protein